MPTAQEIFDHAWHMAEFSAAKAEEYAAMECGLVAHTFAAQKNAFVVILCLHPSYLGVF